MSKNYICLFSVVLLSCQTPSLSRAPSSATAQENSIDPKFEEFEGGSFESEKKINDELIQVSFQLMENVRKKSPTNTMTRDAHAKSHGCLKASFDVDASELPAEYQAGLFKEKKKYSAWVRFSNNDHLPIRRDNEFDLRGMSIKVLGVEGKKILIGSEDALTQDFLMYGSNIFFVKDNKDYVGFIKGLRDDNAAFVLLKEQPKAALKTVYAQWKVSGFTNPANMPYHSAIPIRMGLPEDPERGAAKYRAIPCSSTAHKSPVAKANLNYLRENLKDTLGKGDACFLFQVQLQKDERYFPVEDATVPWPETIQGYGNLPISKYETVARVTIPQQNFDTPERDLYCEHLSITPWHALVEHKPLGRTMRMRRDLYRATSGFRHKANGVPEHEPAVFEIE